MSTESPPKPIYLIVFLVVCVTVVGFFVGLQSPMNPALQTTFNENSGLSVASDENDFVPVDADSVLPAPQYSDMGEINRRRSSNWKTQLADMRSTVDPLAEIVITDSQKSFALALREQNRAFNGAPPTVPHPIDQMSAATCMACHGEGLATKTLRISRMSHQFLANCTQCHVESHFQQTSVTEFRENSFVGLPAPTGGPRAFDGAPPMIPHSTWMRVDCNSCHGPTGAYGIRSTHPWRQNCQQCHAPSSELNQTELDSDPHFLKPSFLRKP